MVLGGGHNVLKGFSPLLKLSFAMAEDADVLREVEQELFVTVVP